MKKYRQMLAGSVAFLALGWVLSGNGARVTALITGTNAFVSSKDLKPGSFRKIAVADLPEPMPPAGRGGFGFARPAPPPVGAMPAVPAGFKVDVFADGLKAPRQIRRAPNGDLFVMEQNAGQITILRGNKDGKPAETSVYATGLTTNFGINFYPSGPNPEWVYVGNTGSVVRFAYKNGDLKASAPPEMLISDLPPRGNHSTRDIVFSKDGTKMFVAVGSADNVSDVQPVQEHRANILQYTPEGKFVKIYASGIRNPVGLGINPETGELWCSVNERDNLGDNLVPDYVTHVERGGFYGWPYFYIGGHPDSRLNGAHPELKSKVLVPDVLLTPHNASLGLTFYDGKQFPEEYRGDLFAAEHGSWNRSEPSGHEVIRVPLEKGKSSGVYQDFLTGFVTPAGDMWGRPVGVTVAQDGSILVTDDGSKSIWRVSYSGKKRPTLP
jgi:glucose/arabinose dehydrogenase